MLKQESYLDENSLLNLQSELNKLTQKYGSYLSEESLDGEVGCLNHWVNSYRQGDDIAGYYLTNYGNILLEKIKTKLQTASTEIQRIDEESPNSKNFTGGKADRLSRAAKAALHAQQTLNEALTQ